MSRKNITGASLGILAEATKVKRIKGNLCHAGGKFTPCDKVTGGADATAAKGVKGATDATVKAIADRIAKDPNASPFEKANRLKLAEAEVEIANTLKNESDTFGRFTDSSGAFKPARAKLHKDILKKADNPNAKPQEQPTVIFFGGLPGSGKSSSVGKSIGMGSKDKKSFVANAVVIDSDAIKGMLPEFNGKNAAIVHEESSYIADTLRKKSMAQKKNIVLDGTFKSPKKQRKKIEEFQKAGYRVEIRFADLPVSKSRERAVRRFVKSGRYVPTGFIQSLSSQGGRSSKNREAFEELKNMADAYIVMNTDVKFGDPAIVIKKKGKLV